MTRKQRNVSLCIWACCLIAVAIAGYQEGQAVLERSIETKGEVVDQVEVSENRGRRRRDVVRPQIEYWVGDEAHLFVARFTNLPNGEKVSVLYDKSDPRDAQLYDWRIWLDLPGFIIILLICGIVQALYIAITKKYSNEPVVLPSHFT